jgi:RHS repeat-associated protein
VLENRSYNSAAMKYDFTGKERDNETNYDYFGARYYDSRIANWTSIDPLMWKHLQWSPYNYVLRNPVCKFDPDGMQVQFNDDPLIRAQEIQYIQYTLPPEYSKYIGSTENNTLDVKLLESAQSDMNADYTEYHQLLFLARSSSKTSFILANDKDSYSLWEYGQDHVQASLRFSKDLLKDQQYSGYTAVDGKSTNSQAPQYISRSGDIEIYILTVAMGKSVATELIVATMAHEMFGHNYLYQMGQRWDHIDTESKTSDFNKSLQNIEDRAKTAFGKH